MTRKNTIIAALLVFLASSILPSCAPTQDCWAYRSVQKYNDSKKRPSVASASGKKKVKIRY